jgi:hypothetical protein
VVEQRGLVNVIHGLMKNSKIEPGKKVLVRLGLVERIGVALRIEDDYVIVRWIHSVEWSDELEYRARRADVEPLEGWI